MTQLSRTCLFDPAKIRLTPKAQKAVLLDFDLQIEQKTAVVRQGTWFILPFAKVLPFTDFYGKPILGVRLIPGQALSESPVLIYSANKATTVSTSLSTALPMIIYRKRLQFSRQKFYELWQEVEDELLDLHAAMGGKDCLEGLRSVLFDDSLFPDESTLDVLPDIARRSLDLLDPTLQHLLYRQYLHKAITQQVATFPLPDGLGAWKNAATVAALQIHENEESQEITMLAAWEVAKFPASIDTSTDYKMVEHMPTPLGNANLRVASAAKILDNHQASISDHWKSDPIWSPTMAIAEDHYAYNGIAHVEAAQYLDEAGQPERAFDALISAAFWSYNYQGEAFPATLDAARHLADKYNWLEISEILESLATLYNLQ